MKAKEIKEVIIAYLKEQSNSFGDYYVRQADVIGFDGKININDLSKAIADKLEAK